MSAVQASNPTPAFTEPTPQFVRAASEVITVRNRIPLLCIRKPAFSRRCPFTINLFNWKRKRNRLNFCKSFIMFSCYVFYIM